jgi:ATP-binding cassette subfamily B protein
MVGFIGPLVLGGRLALKGQLAVGSFGVLVFLTQRLLWPFTRLGETVDQYQRARASTARVLDLLALPVRPVDVGYALPLETVKGDIRFEGVRFAYAGREPILVGLDLAIPAGSTVALVGATGAGKSTIAKLLLRFYEPDAGAIRLDGTNIAEVKIHDLRSAIGFVGQEFFLFDGSVRDNIAYGAFDADAARVEAAARVAHAEEFIRELPEGYATRVGDRGLKLSGGQRQRLAIARAIVKDPRILILDEATSAVDNESERLIQRALRDASRGRSTLIIAHRLSTIRHADRIHVLDHGRIVESGTHGELVAGGGAYAALWRVQTGAATEG